MKSKKRLKKIENWLIEIDKSLDRLYNVLYERGLFKVEPISQARKDLDIESRIARAEEIAARMFAEGHQEESNNEPLDKKLPNKYETIIESITFEEEKPEAKVRIPPNLELGF